MKPSKTEEDKECLACEDAKCKGKDFHCPLHWIIPSSGWIDDNSVQI